MRLVPRSYKRKVYWTGEYSRVDNLFEWLIENIIADNLLADKNGVCGTGTVWGFRKGILTVGSRYHKSLEDIAD